MTIGEGISAAVGTAKSTNELWKFGKEIFADKTAEGADGAAAASVKVPNAGAAGVEVLPYDYAAAEALDDNAAKPVVKKATEATNWVGGINAGLQVISCAFDVYQFSQAWEGSNKGATTALAEKLRRIVKEESRIRTGG